MNPNILTDGVSVSDELNITIPSDICHALIISSYWLRDNYPGLYMMVSPAVEYEARYDFARDGAITSVTTTFADGTVEMKEIDTEEAGDAVVSEE